MALVTTRDVPLIARVDDSNVLTLLDRATAPAAVRAPLAQNAGFEAAIPWELLSLARPLSLAIALTGSGEGTGAGNVAVIVRRILADKNASSAPNKAPPGR